MFVKLLIGAGLVFILSALLMYWLLGVWGLAVVLVLVVVGVGLVWRKYAKFRDELEEGDPNDLMGMLGAAYEAEACGQWSEQAMYGEVLTNVDNDHCVFLGTSHVARALANMGREEEAFGLIEELERSGVYERANLLDAKSKVLFALGRIEEGLDLLAEIMALEPGEASHAHGFAHTLICWNGDYERAEAALANVGEARKEEASMFEGHEGLAWGFGVVVDGMIAYERGQYDKAREKLELAAENLAGERDKPEMIGFFAPLDVYLAALDVKAGREGAGVAKLHQLREVIMPHKELKHLQDMIEEPAPES